MKHSEYYNKVAQYIKDIDSGVIPACTWVKLAIKRFKNDLKRETEEGWQFRFDESKFVEIVEFVESLTLADMDKPIELLPWQLFVYCNLFGFVYKDNPDRRRFRQAEIVVARKNGKTSAFLYPLILYDFLSTNAAESYLVSASDDQAEKSFTEVTAMIKSDPDLSDSIGDGCHSNAIVYNNSRINFFSCDTKAKDGYRNSLSVIDEFWGYKSDTIVSSFRYGSRARLNGLVVIITSSGVDTNTPAYAEEKKAKAILSGALQDESYFGILYNYDTKEGIADWKAPENFILANPSLGAFLKREVLESDLTDALITPSHEIEFKSKTCGIWCNASSNWLAPEKINYLQDQEQIDYDKLKSVPCYAGLDLSQIDDLSVYTLCWYYNGRYYFKHRYYIPEKQIYEKFKNDNQNFVDWINKGLVTATPGATIDYDYIYQDFVADSQIYSIKELCYDPWHANDLINRLDVDVPGLLLIQFSQQLKNFSAPTKDYEKDIIDHKVSDTNPVLYWNLQSVEIRPDNNGNYKPMKPNKHSTNRIDGVITSIMAHSRAKFYARESAKPTMSFEQLLNSY